MREDIVFMHGHMKNYRLSPGRNVQLVVMKHIFVNQQKQIQSVIQ